MNYEKPHLCADCFDFVEVCGHTEKERDIETRKFMEEFPDLEKPQRGR